MIECHLWSIFKALAPLFWTTGALFLQSESYYVSSAPHCKVKDVPTLCWSSKHITCLPDILHSMSTRSNWSSRHRLHPHGCPKDFPPLPENGSTAAAAWADQRQLQLSLHGSKPFPRQSRISCEHSAQVGCKE